MIFTVMFGGVPHPSKLAVTPPDRSCSVEMWWSRYRVGRGESTFVWCLKYLNKVSNKEVLRQIISFSHHSLSHCSVIQQQHGMSPVSQVIWWHTKNFQWQVGGIWLHNWYTCSCIEQLFPLTTNLVLFLFNGEKWYWNDEKWLTASSS